MANRIDKIPNEYTIDLDLPAQERWIHVAFAERRNLQKLADTLPVILRDQFNGFVAATRKSVIRPLCYMKPLPREYSQEIYGISKLTTSYGLTYGDLVLFNTALDYLSKCTSMIMSSPEGQLHFRTLDWGLALLKDLTISVSFKKNGSILYKGITFIGCVGLLTGIRIQRSVTDVPYSLTYNFRKPVEKRQSLCHLLKCYVNRTSVSFFLRSILENKGSYSAALETINKGNLSCCGYVSICGVKIKQGCVVTFGRGNKTEKKMINRLLVQTNHDDEMEAEGISESWADGDPLLLSTIARKKSLTDAINERNCNRYTAEELMLRAPVWNKDTVYFCMLKPKDGGMYCIV